MTVFLVFSCNNGTKVKYIPKSNGNINTVSVIMPMKYWKNDLGKIVKKVFFTGVQRASTAGTNI